jgi:hypothetical protein
VEYNVAVISQRFFPACTLFLLIGCGGTAANGLRIQEAGGEVRAEVRESGALLLDGRRIATVDADGKVKTSRGKLLGWIHVDSIRLAGGAQLAIRKNAKGEIYLDEKAQSDAGLEPVTAHVDAGGKLTRARIYTLEGAHGDRDLRVALFLLVLLQNPSIR